MPKRQNLSLQRRTRTQRTTQRAKQKPGDGPHGMEQLTDVRPIRSMLSNRTEFLIGTDGSLLRQVTISAWKRVELGIPGCAVGLNDPGSSESIVRTVRHGGCSSVW